MCDNLTKLYNIKIKTNFLLILLWLIVLLNQVESILEYQKTQNLNIGSCVGKPSDFCSKQVDNSICNDEKNECFCKRGFVAIREEEDKVSCKTLLTDLKCRMDRDCNHVNSSTCHPGAGYCSCPGHTIYSSELHACRVKTFQIENNQFCLVCRNEGGVCFFYKDYDKKTAYIRADNSYVGCACPMKRFPISDIKHEICNNNLVDIGDYCDDNKDICRSKKAICAEKSLNNQIKICVCPKGYIKLYQSNLHYHECFPILNENSPLCSLCAASKGTCYDINDDDVGDGCICPSMYSTAETQIEFKHQNQFCTISHLESNCKNNILKVCYKPHSQPPYDYLKDDLINKNAIIRLIGGSDFKANSECFLNFVEDENQFCINIDLLEQIRECGIRSYKIAHRKLQYEFILEVLSNKSFKTPSKDMQFPLSCITKEPESAIKTYQTSTKSNQDIKNSIRKQKDKFNLGLQVLDNNNNEIESVEEGSIIKLDLSLIDTKGKYKAISVEQCYFSNYSTIDYADSLSDKSVLLIKKGCPNVREGFMANFRSRIMPGIHIQSDGFHAFKLTTDSNILFIDCFIKVCINEANCWQIDCNKSPQQISQPKDDKSNYVIVRRRTQLNILKKRRFTNTKKQNKVTFGKCTYAVCLTALQTSVMAALLVTLIILIIFIILVIYRKNRLYQEQNKMAHHCLNEHNQSFYSRHQHSETKTHPVRHRCISLAMRSIDDINENSLRTIPQSDFLPTPIHRFQLVNDYEMENSSAINQNNPSFIPLTSTVQRTPNVKVAHQSQSQAETVTRV